MPAIARQWTRQEVLDLIERNPLLTPRYEVVDGVLLVTPSPSYTHQRAVARLLYTLMQYLDAESGVGEAFTSPSDTEPEAGTVVQPDVYIIPFEQSRVLNDSLHVRTMLLAVEVLSPRDPSGDRTRKRAMYQRTVPEYWIVDHSERHIEVWRPDYSVPVIVDKRLEWHPARASKPFVLDVPAYFARVNGETL